MSEINKFGQVVAPPREGRDLTEINGETAVHAFGYELPKRFLAQMNTILICRY
jgi:hypothetical protein